jgi:8-oxo-dGTP pyrophosphatase MutT (NUDIX family)
MYTPRIILKKKFQFSDIRVEIVSDEWKANPAYDEQVAKAWVEKQELAKKEGATIWDGLYYRVVNVDEIEKIKEPILRLGTIYYRYIHTAPLLKESFFANKFEPPFHLSTTAAIRTSDGFYLFGKRSRNGAIDLIGGGVQKDQLEITNGDDLEKNLLKEMAEEAGIQKSDIKEIEGIGILHSITSNILIVAHVQLNLSKQEAIAAFENRGENEMAEPIFIPEAELKPSLQKMTSYRPLIAELLEG